MDFLVYAIAYRLAIVAAGTIFMYFGYRLFMQGIISGEGSEMGGEHGDTKFLIKNVAPGTFFALFGMMLIGIMVWQGNPELRTTKSSGDQIVLRGGPNPFADSFDLMDALNSNASSQTQIQDYGAQLANADLSLAEASGPMLGLAAAFLKDDRPDEAISLVRLVYQHSGDDAETLALMAMVENARGETATAQQVAARLYEKHPNQTALIDATKQDLLR